MRGELGSDLDKSTADLSPESDNEVTAISIDKLVIGQQYDVLDASKRWCEGEVQKIDKKAGSVFVTYVYWDYNFDEWIDAIESRFAPLHTHTYCANGRLQKGQRVEALDEHQQWLEAFVVDEDDQQGNLSVKIHYKGFHAKFDEWILRSDASTRIRPYGRHKNIASKRNSAMSSQSGRPLQAQKQYKVPGGKGRPTSAGAQIGNIPGRLKGESKDCSRIKMPSGELPLIHGSGVENTSSDSQMVSYNQNNNHTDEADDRTRRITNLSAEYVQYLEALARRNLRVESVEGDGNCLFRAVAHQVYGTEELHQIVRQKCVDYMESEADFFSQFVEGGKEMFPLYLRAKRMDACWGDDPEIEAICELYDRRAEIWAFDAAHGARKLRTFHETSLAGFQRDLHDISSLIPARPGSASSSSSRAHAHQHAHQLHHAQGHHLHQPQHREAPVIRLSYYGGGHYDSVVDPAHAGNVLHKAPGELEDAHIARAKERRMSRTAPAGLLPPIHLSTSNSSSREALAEAQRVSDAEATERATLEQVLRDSRDAYIRTGYEDLEACLQLSLQQGTYATHRGTLLKEDPRGDNNNSTTDPDSSNAQSSAEAERDLLRIVQEQSERDYYENAILSSLQADGKEDDSVLTEAELLNLAKQESEREAREREARFLGVSEGMSGERKEGKREEAKGENEAGDPFRQHTNTSQTQHGEVQRGGQLDASQRALELAHLSEEEALEMALLQSLTSTSTSSHTHNAGYASQSAASGSRNAHSVQDEGFHTEEELLQMALQASMQGYAGANSAHNASSFARNSSSSNNSNTAAQRTSSTPATGYAINIGAPYVNVHGGGDYSEETDEELMRAIEASLRK